MTSQLIIRNDREKEKKVPTSKFKDCGCFKKLIFKKVVY